VGDRKTNQSVHEKGWATRPIPHMNVRPALMKLFPGDLILELVTGEDQAVTTVILTLPDSVPCPKGTIDLSLLQTRPSPFRR